MTPSFMNSLRQDWLGNIRGDLLAGLVVALALIPEAIAFSIIAGVDPKVGLYASFSIAVLTAITGGRPGMISAATAATAVLMISLVRDHENGLQLLFAATILAGLLQIAMGLLKLGNVMRFVSRSVLTGFVNALAILIFLAQLPEILPAAVPDFLNSILKSAHIGHEVEAVTMTWLHDRRRIGNHILVPTHHDADPIALGLYLGANNLGLGFPLGCSDSCRPG